jgi:putative ABC transport system ATP-binding protein
MPPMLTIANLTKTYGSGEQAVHAVQDVCLTALAGEFLAVIGPSGSGKTTLLAMIGGLLTPTSGTIELGGRNIARLERGQLTQFRRQAVGYVFQANNLLPFLTARENLLVMQAIGASRGSGNQRADQLLRELGLHTRAHALATELSGGERQRVAIGRALMNDPQIVLVDEPTASLDSARGKQVVRLLIDEVKARSKLAIMVTHDLDMAVLADRILEMHDGVLRERAR